MEKHQENCINCKNYESKGLWDGELLPQDGKWVLVMGPSGPSARTCKSGKIGTMKGWCLMYGGCTDETQRGSLPCFEPTKTRKSLDNLNDLVDKLLNQL